MKLNLVLLLAFAISTQVSAQVYNSMEEVLKEHEKLRKASQAETEKNVDTYYEPEKIEEAPENAPEEPKKIQTYETEDQVLGPFDKSLYLRVSKEKKNSYRYGIRFADGKAFQAKIIDTESESEKVWIKFDLQTYQKILEEKRGKIAEIVAFEGNNKVTETNSPKAYIGGPYDLQCEYPVLAADYHGTLQVREQSEIDAIDNLIERLSMPIFVVSTSGYYAKKELDKIKFKNADKFLVLDNVSSPYSENEKAHRIFKMLIAKGVCVVGFAGDSPKKEGDACQELKHIPYFRVGTSFSHNETIQEEVEVNSCVLKKDQSDRTKLNSAKQNCPIGQEKKKINKVICEEMKVTTEISLFIFFNTKTQKLGNTEEFEDSCPDKRWNQKHIWGVSSYHTWQETSKVEEYYCLKPKTYQLYGKNKQCRADYDLVSKIETKYSEKPVYKANEIDYKDYPEGSDFGADWVELSEKIIDSVER